jgi:hypothetical protein
MDDFGTIMSHFVFRCHIFWLDLCIFEFLTYRAFQKYAYCLGLKKVFPRDFSEVTSWHHRLPGRHLFPVLDRISKIPSIIFIITSRGCAMKSFKVLRRSYYAVGGGPKIGESVCSIKGQTVCTRIN